MKVLPLSAVIAVLLLCPTLFADQVTLKNGDRLTGSIEKSDEKTLVIKTEFAGEVTIQWQAIVTIKSDQQLHVGLAGGQMLVGPVSPSDGRLEIATKNAGTVSTTKDAIQVIRSDSEQAAYDASIERLRNPHLTDFWSGFLDTGLSLTSGNSDTLNFDISGQAVRKTTRDMITAYGNAIYANSGTGGPTKTTAQSIGGGLRIDLNLSDRMFVYGLTDFYYDKFQQLNLRNILGGGVGYHVIKTKPTTFDVYGGGDFNQSYYVSLTQKTGEIMVGEYFAHSFSGRTTLSERFVFFPNITDTGAYRYTFDSHAVTKLNNWLGWQVGFDDLYVSNPPVGIKKNDLILTTGLRLTFGGAAQ